MNRRELLTAMLAVPFSIPLLSSIKSKPTYTGLKSYKSFNGTTVRDIREWFYVQDSNSMVKYDVDNTLWKEVKSSEFKEDTWIKLIKYITKRNGLVTNIETFTSIKELVTKSGKELIDLSYRGL